MPPTASCPTCNAALALTPQGEFDSWVCPAGHGRAATLSELYERAQEDEIHRLWQLARAEAKTGAAPDARPCPMCTRPMVTVTVPVDGDEAEEGAEGDTADATGPTVEVCVTDEVIWFEAGEVEALPADLEDAPPTAEEDAALAQIRADFAKGLDEATGTEPAPDSVRGTEWAEAPEVGLPGTVPATPAG